MTKKEFIEKFNLTKTDIRGWFSDGRARKSRVLYANDSGNYYVFYGNDLYTFKPYSPCKCFKIGNEIGGELGAGYSWYR